MLSSEGVVRDHYFFCIIVRLFEQSLNTISLRNFFIFAALGCLILTPVSALARDSLFMIPASSQAQSNGADVTSPGSKRRGTVVTLSHTLLTLKSGDELDFVSLSGETYTVVFDKFNKVHGRSITWVGHLKDLGTQYRVFISLKGKTVMGRINTPEGLMQLRTFNGELRLIDYQQEGLRPTPFPFTDDTVVPEADTTLPPSSQTRSSRTFADENVAEEAPSYINGNAIVDVLVLYNGSFASEYGSTVSARIDQLVSLTNQAYLDSQVTMQIRVVGSQQVNYSNTATNSATLNALTNNTISGIDVDALRNQVGADLVILLRPYNQTYHGSCGIAWLNSSLTASSGFAVASDGSDVGGSNYYCDDSSFAHELGHTMGLTHDINNAGNTGSHSYSYGYGISGSFGTIMSYINPTVGFFSNPNISTCNSSPCGTAAYDNARSLNTDKDILSNFRNQVVGSTDYSLSVVVSGVGTVSSNDGGINCGLDCDELYAENTSVTLTATSGSGYTFSGWSGCPAPTNNTCAISMSSPLTVSAIFIESVNNTSINSALDTIGMAWSLTGDANWMPQSSVFQMGADALQSGAIGNDQQSNVTTTVTGPGTISFYWKVSSEQGYDLLKFYVDNVEMAAISGETAWQQKTFDLGAGSHELRWRYVKDSSLGSGSDAGWLDGVYVNVPWSVSSQGDFNVDGFPDLLLRNYNHGKNQLWYLSGSNKTGQADLPTIPDTYWTFEGLADFNSDGKPDLLLRNHNHGANQIWYMDNAKKIGQVSLPTILDSNWIFEGAGDFNGDNKPDLVLRNHSHGANQIWFMNGATKIGQASLPTILDTNWFFEAVADFNGDNKPDLVLRNHKHGQNLIWYMDGVTKIGQASLPTIPDTLWSFQGSADYNGDNAADLLLRNYLHGGNLIWYLNGASKTGQASLPTIPDTNWRIENR